MTFPFLFDGTKAAEGRVYLPRHSRRSPFGGGNISNSDSQVNKPASMNDMKPETVFTSSAKGVLRHHSSFFFFTSLPVSLEGYYVTALAMNISGI